MSEFLQSVVTRLESQFAVETLAPQMGGLAANALVATFTFAAFYVVWLVMNGVAAILLRRARVDATTASFSQLALKFAVLTLGAIQALSAVGINTAALLTSLGVAGLTIGFAAKDALSNLISGVLIFWDRPFVIGDLVEVQGQYGRVERITLRSTRVVTPDGRMLAVPNATIVNTVVASYTNFPNLRLAIPVTVGVTEDLDRVREILVGLVRDDPDFLDAPAAAVSVTALNDYNVALELTAWIRDEKRHLTLRPELRERVYKALTTAQVDMPFETLNIRPLEVRTV